MSTADRMYAAGRLLGYPACCVRAFIADVRHNPAALTARSKYTYGTGYIPCKMHFECLKQPGVHVTDFLHGRDSRLPPFPHASFRDAIHLTQS